MFTVINVLLEGVPKHIDVYRLCSEIEDIEGVTIIHDVHVWTITSGSESFTAHIFIDPAHEDVEGMRAQVQDIVHNGHGIRHATIQIEKTTANCLEDHHVEHLQFTSRPSGM